jgi:DnaK suppressor protein
VLGAMLVLRTRGSQREEREKKEGRTRIVGAPAIPWWRRGIALIGRTREHICGRIAEQAIATITYGWGAAVNASGLNQYKQLLLAKRSELLPATVGTLLNAGGAEGWPGDPTDWATEETQTTLRAHLRESDSHLLRAIEEALARIAQGTFGVCDACQRPIAEARLKAVPWTRLCRDCKEQRTA